MSSSRLRIWGVTDSSPVGDNAPLIHVLGMETELWFGSGESRIYTEFYWRKRTVTYQDARTG